MSEEGKRAAAVMTTMEVLRDLLYAIKKEGNITSHPQHGVIFSYEFVGALEVAQAKLDEPEGKI